VPRREPERPHPPEPAGEEARQRHAAAFLAAARDPGGLLGRLAALGFGSRGSPREGDA
jgi:hypothetical protein